MPTLLLFVVTSNQLVIVFVPQSTNMAFVVVFGLFLFSLMRWFVRNPKKHEWSGDCRINDSINPPCLFYRHVGTMAFPWQTGRQAGRQTDRQTDRQAIHHCCQGAGMLHLCELQVLCRIYVVERDREVVGKLACY